MPENNGGGKWATVGELAKSFGLSGTIILVGLAIIGLALYKASEFSEHSVQIIALVAGLVTGAVAIAVGLVLILRAPRENPSRDHGHDCDIFLAVPMAGFEDDTESRKAAVELVHSVDAALKKLPGIKDIHASALVRPKSYEYETPANAFDVELKALKGAKRYVLILPPVLPSRDERARDDWGRSRFGHPWGNLCTRKVECALPS